MEFKENETMKKCTNPLTNSLIKEKTFLMQSYFFTVLNLENHKQKKIFFFL